MPSALLKVLLGFLHKARAVEADADLNDGALLERFLAQRDDAAFEVLLQRHGPMVLGVCWRVIGDVDSHAAEDAFQATFLVLARRAASIRDPASLASWLYGVAQRIACRARAQAAIRRQREKEAAIAMRRCETLDDLTWQELRGVLDEEIGRLPEKYRAPVVLCLLEGKSYDQAAKELGCPKSSLASRLSKALELLRGQLTRRGIALSAAALATALTEKATAAPVPALLGLSILKAAASVAAGEALAAGILSTRAIALAEEAMKTMIGIKMKVVALALTLCLAAGAAFAGYDAWLRHTTPEQLAPVVLGDPQKKDAAGPAVDLHGDPLPDGAAGRLGTVRWRHAGLTTFAAFLPDGQSVLSTGMDNTIRTWEYPSGKELRRISLPVASTSSFEAVSAVSADNKRG
jgi:RNA polymerase sigma factor (sigma-70 family)